MTEDRVRDIESLLNISHMGGYSHTQALEMRTAIYDLLAALREAQAEVKRFKKFLEQEGEERQRMNRVAHREGERANKAEYLLEKAQEANAGEYRRGAEAAAAILDAQERDWLNTLTGEPLSELARDHIENRAAEMGTLAWTIRALVPPDAPTEGEG